MKHNIEADVRTDTAIKIAALFFVSIMFLAFTTDPIASGTKVGERAHLSRAWPTTAVDGPRLT